MDCPICGIESLTFYRKDKHGPDVIICTQYENDEIDGSCGAVFTLDRNTVRKSWMKKLIKSSCKGDVEFPCPQPDASTGGQDLIQCPSCEALEDEELFFDADARDRQPDVDRTCEHDE